MKRIFLQFISCMLVALNASATTYYVNDISTVGDIYCSAIGSDANLGTAAAPFLTLGKAVTTAAAGDIIYVDAGTYINTTNSQAININISKNLSIIGAGSTKTIFDNNNRSADSNYWISVTGVTSFTITGIYCINYNNAVGGNGQTVLSISNSSGVTITDVETDYNRAGGGNSAIVVAGSTTATFNAGGSNCNPAQASIAGGGFLVTGANNNLSFTNYSFSGNSVDVSGGSGLRIASTATTITIANSIFQGNKNGSASAGAALYLGSATTVNITNSRFVSNSVSYTNGATYGGAIGAIAGTINVTGSVFQGNSNGTSGRGGAIGINGNVTINLNTCTFTGNVGNSGNDIYSRGTGTINVNNCTFPATGTSIFQAGGAINVQNSGAPITSGTVNMINTTVPSSTANPVTPIFDASTCRSSIATCSVSIATTSPTCGGTTTGSAVATASNGTAPYTFRWSNGFTSITTIASPYTSTITNAGVGTYIVSITDNVGCVSTATAVITEPTPWSLDAVLVHPKCHAKDGSITLRITGTATPATYTWSNGGASPINAGLGSGAYTVTVTIGTCSQVKTFLLEDVGGPTVTLTPSNAACSASNGSVSVAFTGNNGNVNINWTGAASGSATGQSASPYTATGLPAGDYTFTVIDGAGQGCLTSAKVTVGKNTTMTAASSVLVSPACGLTAMGSIGATVTGTANFAYRLFNASNVLVGTANTASTTQSFTGLLPGVYQLSVTDVNGCIATSSVTLNSATNIAISPIVVQPACIGSKGSITGISSPTAGYIYGISAPSIMTLPATGLSAGVYTIGAINLLGCQSFTQVTITEPSPWLVEVYPTNETCSVKGNIITSVSGGTAPYTYAWSTGQNTSSIINLSAGSYTLTVTGTGGCTMVTPAIPIVKICPCNLQADAFVVETQCGTSAGKAEVRARNNQGSVTYSWSTGAATNSILGLASGRYAVTINDTGLIGCSIVKSVVVESVGAPGVTLTPTAPTTCNGTNGSIAVAYSPTASTTVTLAWSGPSSGSRANVTTSPQTIPSLSAGTYSVSVTTSTGCTNIESVVIPRGTGGMTVTLTPTSPTSCGFNNGSIAVGVSGGTPAYSYTLIASNGTRTNQPTSTFLNLTAGAYQVSVTDASGCVASLVSTNLNSNSTTITATATPITCVGGRGTITVAAPLAGYVYSVYPPNGGAALGIPATNLTAGVYTIEARNSSNCSSFTQVTITEPAPWLVELYPSPLACNTGATIASVVSGGSTPATYTYSWNTTPVQTTATATGITTTGAYAVTITGAAGCSVVSSSANVTASTLNAPTITGDPSICNGQTTTLDAGSGYTSYLWSTSATATTQTITVSTAGTYSVTVTNANGCTASASVTLTVNSSLTPSITGVTSICNGQTTTLNAGSGYTSYLWSTPTSTTATTSSITASTTGTYSVTVSLNGCTGTASVNLTVTPNPTVTITGLPSLSVCSGTPTTLNAGSGYNSYLWSTPTTTATTSSITAGTAGTYSVTVSLNGCTGTASVNLTVTPNPTVTISGLPSLSVCSGTLTTLTAGAGFSSYAWSTGATTQTINVNATANTNTSVTTYSVTVTNSASCTGTASVNLTVTPNPTVTITDLPSLSVCSGTAVTLKAGAGYTTYNWSTGATIDSITVNTAGTYSVTVSNANGCTGTASVNLTVTPNPTVTIAGLARICQGTVATYTATAAGTPSYLWSTGATTQTLTITANTDGTYTYSVIVTNVNGCSGTAALSVTVSPNPIITTVTPSNSAACTATGTASATVTGGTTPYSYSWSGSGQATSTITGLSAGFYKPTVTDANSCTATYAAVEVTSLSSLTVTLTGPVVDVLCFGGNNGAATVLASGGTAPYNYVWRSSTNAVVSNTASATGLARGNYSVSVTDATNCAVVFNVLIGGPTATLAATVVLKTPTSCNRLPTGELLATATGGTPNYTFRWASSTATAVSSVSLTGLAAGSYVVTVTDANNCTALAASVNVTATPNPTVTISAQPSSPICSGTAVTLTAGAGFSTYAWSTGATTQTINVNANTTVTTYSVTVSLNGCTGTASVNLTVTPNPTVTAPSVVNVVCFGDKGSVSVTVSGGTSPYSYSWSDSQTIALATGLTTGNYTVTVTDANGCTAVSSAVTITSPAAITTTVASSVNACNNTSTGSGSVTANGGTSPYTFLWNVTPSQTGNALTGLIPGSYTVTTTDANGCKNVSTLVIGNNQSPRITLNSGGCAITNNTRIEVVNANAYTNFTWSNNATTPVINGLGNGTYTVTATDLNGCTTSAFTNVNSPNLILAANVGNACQGATSSIDLSVTPANINTLSYAWSNRATSQDLNAIPAGVYTVTVIDNASQCSATAAYTMTEVVLTANAGTASTVTSGTSTILTGQYSPSNASVLWRVYQTSTVLSNTNTYTAAPSQTTIYEFLVSDRGCSVSSNVTLTVRNSKPPQFPNFFTPDGDTTNDTFGPVFTSDIDIIEFRIFNRWGEMLHDSPNNWTGIWNSEMQARDSYVYRCIYRFKGKTENETPVYGEVTLVR